MILNNKLFKLNPIPILILIKINLKNLSIKMKNLKINLLKSKSSMMIQSSKGIFSKDLIKISRLNANNSPDKLLNLINNLLLKLTYKNLPEITRKMLILTKMLKKFKDFQLNICNKCTNQEQAIVVNNLNKSLYINQDNQQKADKNKIKN